MNLIQNQVNLVPEPGTNRYKPGVQHRSPKSTSGRLDGDNPKPLMRLSQEKDSRNTINT